jgi:hypothetical protein
MTEPDLVNHPPHYVGHPSGVEVIRYTRLLPFGPGNAVKYVMRRDAKHTPITDLEKAEWYLKDCLVHGITYDVTAQMLEIVWDVIDTEPNPTVVGFLHAMFKPSEPHHSDGWFNQLIGVKPDLDLALDLVRALKEEYL